MRPHVSINVFYFIWTQEHDFFLRAHVCVTLQIYYILIMRKQIIRKPYLLEFRIALYTGKCIHIICLYTLSRGKNKNVQFSIWIVLDLELTYKASFYCHFIYANDILFCLDGLDKTHRCIILFARQVLISVT